MKEYRNHVFKISFTEDVKYEDAVNYYKSLIYIVNNLYNKTDCKKTSLILEFLKDKLIDNDFDLVNGKVLSSKEYAKCKKAFNNLYKKLNTK